MPNTNGLPPVNIDAVSAALTLLQNLSADDIIAIQKARKVPPEKVVEVLREVIAKQEQQHRKPLTLEERKAHKNEAQRLVRSTPEGRLNANEASKRSIASRKHAEQVRVLMAERIALYLADKSKAEKEEAAKNRDNANKKFFEGK